MARSGGGCTAAGTNDGILLWGNSSVNACTKQTKDLSCPRGTDKGTKPEGNKSTCCPKDQVFTGTKCVKGNIKNLEICPSGWGCQMRR